MITKNRTGAVKNRPKAKVSPLTVLKYLGSKLKTAVLVFVALVTMTMTLAVPAQANALVDWAIGEGENMILSTFCNSPGSGYKVSPVSLALPGSGDATDPEQVGALNAAEIIGNAPHYTNWWGWKNNESVQGDGKDTGVGAVADVGGKDNNGGIDGWESEAGKYPIWELQGTCLEGETMFNTSVANALADLNYLTLYGISFLLDVATAGLDSTIGKAFVSVGTVITQIITDNVVWEFFNAALVIGVLVLAYLGLVKKRSTQFMTGLFSLIVTAVIISVLTLNPLFAVKAGEKVQDFSGGVTASLMSKGIGMSDPMAQQMCETGIINGDEAAANSREIKCVLWFSFYYKPWLVGQFGPDESKYIYDKGIPANGTSSALGDVLTGGDPAKTIKSGGYETNTDLAHVYARSMVDDGTAAENMKLRAMYNVSAMLLATDEPAREFAGEVSSARIAYQVAAGIGALCLLLMVASIMIPLIMRTFALVFMGTFVMFKLLIGLMVPNTFGPQGHAFSKVLGLLIQIFILNLFLALAMLVIIVITTNTTDTLSNMICCIIVCLGAIVYRKEIIGAADPSPYMGSFGGDSSAGAGMEAVANGAAHKVSRAAQNGGRAAGRRAAAAGGAVAGRNLRVPADSNGAGLRPKKAPSQTKTEQTSASAPAPRKEKSKEALKSVRENGFRQTAATTVKNTAQASKAKKEERLIDRAKAQELKKAGYRTTVPLSTRGAAVVAGLAVGSAGRDSVIAKGRDKQMDRNSAAVVKVEAIRQKRQEEQETKHQEMMDKRETFHAPRREAESRVSANEQAGFAAVRERRELTEAEKKAAEERKARIFAREEKREEEKKIKKEWRENQNAQQGNPARSTTPPVRAEKPEVQRNAPTPRAKR